MSRYRARLSQTEEIRGTLQGSIYRGYSAYQIAVQHGYEGTEEEWLESLHGKDGHSPEIRAERTGSKQSTIYVDGEPAVNILDGIDGVTPVKGRDYWTESDKTEIVQEVLRLLVPEGDVLLGGDIQS